MTELSSTALTEALGHAISDKRLEVLRLIGQSGSISQAARDAGISYKAAWQAIDTLSSLSGVALVERTVGGLGGGGARLTAKGQELLAMAHALAQARQQVLARFAGGAPLATRLGLRTSMRNQLPCEVVSCEPVAPDDPMARVQLRTPGGALLTASLTRESADLLGLQPGLGVLALCKATAVQVAPAPRLALRAKRVQAGATGLSDPVPSHCSLQGRVERLSEGSGRDEVVLALEGGGHWVGFAEHPFQGQPGDLALATVPSTALVVGLEG